MKAVIVAILLAALGAGVYFATRPAEIPELVFTDSDGHEVTLSDIRGDTDGVLIVILIAKDPLSKFSAGILNEIYPGKSDILSFVGLVFGDNRAAGDLQAALNIPFPCYGIRDSRDPTLWNKFLEKVGFAHGMKNAIYGGTIVLVDGNNKVLFKLEQDEVKQLSEKLSDEGF